MKPQPIRIVNKNQTKHFQISSKLLVETNKYRRAVKRDGVTGKDDRSGKTAAHWLGTGLYAIRACSPGSHVGAGWFLSIRIEAGTERSDELQVAGDGTCACKQEKMENRMKLHENTELFEELLTAASQPEEQVVWASGRLSWRRTTGWLATACRFRWFVAGASEGIWGGIARLSILACTGSCVCGGKYETGAGCGQGGRGMRKNQYGYS